MSSKLEEAARAIANSLRTGDGLEAGGWADEYHPELMVGVDGMVDAKALARAAIETMTNSSALASAVARAKPDIVERLIKIADACRRDTGQDIPLGQELREAADEIERLRERVNLANYRADNLHADMEKLRATTFPLPPHVIAAAWGAWRPRHKDRMGPGPAFVEAIEAAVRALFPVSEDTYLWEVRS